MTEEIPHEEEILMARIVLALEMPPDVRAPDDFAARVMNQLPERKRSQAQTLPAHVSAPHYGRFVTFVAIAVLCFALPVITPAARTSSTWMALQMVLLAQLCAYALWMGLSRSSAM